MFGESEVHGLICSCYILYILIGDFLDGRFGFWGVGVGGLIALIVGWKIGGMILKLLGLVLVVVAVLKFFVF